MHQPTIRPMRQADLDAADRVYRIAFGTRFRLPDPGQFRGDAQAVRTRWATDATTAFVAEINDTIAGGACAMDWGSVLIIGPIFVHPDYSGRGIARLLMQQMVAFADARAAKLAALFTFPESATHLRLYESFGFASQALTPVMARVRRNPSLAAVPVRVAVCRNPAPDKALRAIADVAATTLSTNPVDKIVRIL